MKRLVVSALIAAAFVLGAARAEAGVPRQFSYQGVLTDNVGTIVPDGSYDLTVRLYTVASGGSAVVTEAHPATTVARGGFSIVVGETASLAAIDANGPLYLSLQVGADPEMSPRVQLTASPYAMGLNLPASLSDNSAGAMLTLRNAGTGSTLVSEGTSQIGSSANTGKMVLRAPSSGANDLLTIQPYGSTALGGEVRFNDENGSAYAVMEPDFLGDGGFFSIDRPGGLTGFLVDGNSANSSPRVSILGNSSNMVFDAGTTGDASVQLPSASVASGEILDEPGVARSAANSFLSLSGGVDALTSRTITCPDAGYVVAIANCELWIDHTSGNLDRNILTVDNSVPGSITGNSYEVFELPSTAATGNYRNPSCAVGVFSVAAGANTFYLLAQEVTPGASEGYAQNPSLTLMYFPTSYGTVTSTIAQPIDSKTNAGPLSSTDVAAEQAEARTFDMTRMQRELDTMRARMDAMQRALASDPQAAHAKGN